jgi:proteasome lid subunit RPN8/RPN11
MNVPEVYIEKEPFLIMLLASIETFKRECLGYIFGHGPIKGRNSFIISNAIAVQLAHKRRNVSIEQSQLSLRNMGECFIKYPGLYSVLGDFHSHPEWGSHKREPYLSDGDIEEMLTSKYPLAIVIKISSINKDRLIWQSASDGGVKGSLGKHKFHINVFRIGIDKNNKWSGECLTIQTPAAIKSLNRALGYK